jgi:hypothetical protein
LNVYVEPTGRLIEPFGDPPGDALILNRPLSAWLAEALAAAGLTRVERLAPPCLVVPDALFTTSGALRAFVQGAAGRDAVLVLKDSVYGRNSTPVQPGVEPCEAGWRFAAVRFVSGRGEPPVDVVVDPEEQVIKMPMPTHYVGQGEIEIPFPKHPLMTVHHWVHILWANQVAGSIELRATPKWRFILTGLWALLRARSLNRWRLLSKVNRIGKHCDIHPTAIIEGSTLGDGVSVGPFARVLFSRVGDGAGIMAGAMAEACTIGERAVVSQQTVIRFCVLYPESIASQYLMQQCVLGRRAVTTGGAFSMDLNFDGPIRVPLDGRLHSTGTQFLGSAFGHRARIGTGHWLASGRMVPNEAFLIRDPRDVIARIAPTLGGQGPLVNDAGTLRPLAASDAPQAGTDPWVSRILASTDGRQRGDG